MPSPLPRGIVGCSRCSLPQRQRPSPKSRRVGSPHYLFRGLLSVHTRYGLNTRRVALRPSTPEALKISLPTSPLRLLPTGATVVGWDLHPLKIRAFSRRTGFGIGCTSFPYSTPTKKRRSNRACRSVSSLAFRFPGIYSITREDVLVATEDDPENPDNRHGYRGSLHYPLSSARRHVQKDSKTCRSRVLAVLAETQPFQPGPIS